MPARRPHHTNHGKLLSQALREQRAGRPEKTARLCREILQHDPGHPEANHLLGLALAARGDFAAARAHLERAASRAPGSADIQNNLGNACRASGDLDRAQECYRRALALKPDMAQAHANLGVVCKLRGRLEEAAGHYLDALRLNPDMAGVHYTLGIVRKEQGRPMEAAECLRRALTLDPASADAHASLGQVLREQIRTEEAASHFLRAVALNPRLATVHEALGQIYKEQGKLDEAVSCFRRAIVENPRDPSARYHLAALCGEPVTAAPPDYVRNLFDQYADSFDRHLAEKLGYLVPQELRSLFETCAGGRRRFRRALDLGCGTGLCGERFRDVADRLDGMDLSPKMLEKAAEKKIYETLRLGNIAEIPEGENGPYDLFLAADTFIYIGDLVPVFRSVARCAAAGALFLFSTETCDAETYVLRKTCRYAHSRRYIQSLAMRHGFSVIAQREGALRRELGEWIGGEYHALQYAG